MSEHHKQPLAWQDLQPKLDSNVDRKQKIDFFDLQPTANKAIKQFLQNSYRKLLVLKTDDQIEYAPMLAQFIQAQLPPLQICGVRYDVQQADSSCFAKINVQPAQSYQDNFAAQQQVAVASYFDANTLFGTVRVHRNSGEIALNAGLVHQLNNGVLILNLSRLLSEFECWQRLKQILISGRFDWFSVHPFKTLPCEIPGYCLSLKVILLGNREEIAHFAELETELYPFGDYAEVESYIEVEQAVQQQNWQQYVQSLAQQHQFASLTDDGLEKLYQLLVRQSESRLLINTSPSLLKSMLTETQSLSGSTQILTAIDFQQFFQQKAEQYGFLRQQAYRDIFHQQVYLETDGEAVGQINALSVIEFAGVPTSFGEPSRISCIVQFGDGDVVDVERKNELAGSLHSKGMMIAQSCLSNILSLPSQLPFSAWLVFEQSYNEIDGDSASLAIFLALVSALADVPVAQSIAVTGAIDQFGLVHSVGGINDKIEGFFAICKGRGLTGKQGVIIPESSCYQLCLTDEVVNAVREQQFFIWAVNDVFEACEILFDQQLVAENEENKASSLIHLINRRIESHADQHHSVPFWLKWLHKK